MGTNVNVLLCLSHSIEEHDQVKLFGSLGLGVASIGGYIDPAHPHDPKRPALDVPAVPEVIRAVDAAGGLAAAQSRIPTPVLDWLGDDGVIIFHHLLERLMGQWHWLRDWLHGSADRRVIWRTVGQSNPDLEAAMAMLRRDGLEIVRYSPNERRIPNYAGEDALIRFYKDPQEWSGWTGERPVVTTVAQNMMIRDPFTNYGFWQDATEGLPTEPLGVGSETIGGPGTIDLADMVARLRSARAYLYTGTQPASYTLALIEAMMIGIPVVSIPATYMRLNPWGPSLFEGQSIVPGSSHLEDAGDVRRILRRLIEDRELAALMGAECRATAIRLFGRDTIAAAWSEYLRVTAAVAA